MAEGRRVRLRFKWEPRDIWVGIYWDRKKWWGGFDDAYSASASNGPAELTENRDLHAHHEFHLYLTIIPMLPLHLSVKRCPRPSICRAGDCPVAQERKASDG